MTITPLAQSKKIRRTFDNSYYLYDTFTTDRAAGAVNGTLAEPVGGARTVVDTNGKISISGGVLSFATGTAIYDAVRYPIQTRQLGKVFTTTMSFADTNGGGTFGIDATTGTDLVDLFRALSAGNLRVTIGSSTSITVATYTATTYSLVIIHRTAGVFFFIKGGAYTNWTMLYNSLLDVNNSYPVIQALGATTAFTADDIRVPTQTYIPVPLQSDGMSNSLTDGLGNPENNGTAGNAYTDVGTWGVAAGKRSCSALSGGLGFSYLPTTSSNIIIEAVCTRSAGVTGLVARYADANNYLISYHDGVNAKLDKVVAGVTTNLLTAVVAYSATAVTSLHLDGTTARLFYNNTAVGTSATTPAAGSLNHGLYTTDVNATFDNLVIFARGNSEGQYIDMELL